MHLDKEAQCDYDWRVPADSWELRPDFFASGTLDLSTAMDATVRKKCKYPVDHLYSLYGLLKDEDKVQVDYCMNASENERMSKDILIAKWRETMVQVVQLGKVWPLLKDVMVPETRRGEIWMPSVCGNLDDQWGERHPEIVSSRNTLPIAVMDAGLAIHVRRIGRVVAWTPSFGDGSGEWNRVMAWIWHFGQRGCDIAPVRQQMAADLDKHRWAGVEGLKRALSACLHAGVLRSSRRMG